MAQNLVKIQNYRPDIDGLRALAVLSVVCFHAFPGLLPGGFVGVDIFFVISGYLISGIMYKGMDAGSFRFSTFYAHRIKRIFPVLSVVMLCCYFFGWFALLPDEFQTLGREMLGGAGFYANLLLWQDTGYFDTVAHTKPLLHLWSLGVEEQFYFAWPLILFAAYRLRRATPVVIVLLMAASFVSSLHLMAIDPAGSFYSPLSRFWELLAGAMLAWLVKSRTSAEAGQPPAGYHGLSVIGGVLLLGSVFLLDESRIAFPGWWATLPVLGAFLLIYAGPDAVLNRRLLSHPLAVWIGLISYPLYLWHWPILSFSRIVLAQDLPWWGRCLAVALSILLAWISWRWIERPIRFGIPGRGKIIVLCLLMALVAWLGHDAERRHGLPFRIKLPLSVMDDGISRFPQCPDVIGQGANAPEYCRRSAGNQTPDRVVIGDSHARSVFPGFASMDQQHAWLLLANPSCPPTLGLTIHEPNGVRHCAARRDRVMQYVEENASIHTVVLAFFADYILDTDFAGQRKIDHWASSVQMSSPDMPGASKAELFYHGLENTIRALTKANKSVVIMMDVPELPFLTHDCVQRPLFKLTPRCELARTTVLARQGQARLMVKKLVANNPQVRVFDPINVFCGRSQCKVTDSGTLLYRDSDHLNWAGSRLLAPPFLSWLQGGQQWGGAAAYPAP
ncbi:acyltransferase family protein [Paludibacterium sp. THUN1379]|uniref:acyltransferase family protein n=1 Tax=Paludibacterium sp. THUN1379 TaxID=3112107 RepID=UPI0030D61502